MARNKMCTAYGRPIYNRAMDIYTDGSFKGHWGSWAYVIVKEGQILCEASGRVRKTDSNRMEFQAAIEALSSNEIGSCPQKLVLNFFTDSRILIEKVERLAEFEAAKWRNKSDRPIPNADLLKKIQSLLQAREAHNQINWNWVKAHSGNIFNERCDELCVLSRAQDPS